MMICSERHPALGYGCEREAGHPSAHSAVGLRWEDPPADPGPIVHLAVSGPVGGVELQHAEGECVFCDAERFRRWDGSGGHR